MRRAAFVFAALILLLAAITLLLALLFAVAVGLLPVAPVFRALAAIFLGLLVLSVMTGGRAMGGRARRWSAPFTQLIDAAGRIENGDYSARLSEWPQPPLRNVARAFNSMSARLEAIDSGRRAFLADIAHELRTPLSVVRGQAEGIADGLYPADPEHLAPILAATGRLERLVEDLRTLSLVQSGALPLRREPVEVGLLASDCASELAPLALRRRVAVTVDAAAEVVVEADAARLATVFLNLLTNAVAHSPEGGEVVLSAHRTAGTAVVRVEDSGPGIPAEILPRVFQRFVKGEGSEGSGLGLAIAHEIVLAHGGRIAAGNRDSGGAWFEVVLPAG